MKNLTLLLSIFLSFNLFAESVNFDIAQLDFKRPEKNVGSAGNLQFNRMSLFYYDFMSEITNEDGRFNAKLFVRKNFLGLTAPQMKFGLYTHPGDMLYSLQRASGENLKVIMNTKKVSVKSTNVCLKTPELFLKIDGQNSLFCQKTRDFSSNSPEDLEKACLHYLNFTSQTDSTPFVNFESTATATEEDPDPTYLKFSGGVKQFELADQRINFVGTKMLLNLNQSYLIRTNQIDFSCAKKQLDTFDTDQLTQFCLHDFNIAPRKNIEVQNLEDQSSFSFYPQVVKLQDETLSFKTPEFIISYPGEGDSILTNMQMNCHVANDSDATDVSAYVDGCLHKSTFYIGSLDSSGNTKDKKKGRLRNVKVNIRDGQVTMTSEVKFLFKFHLSLKATASFDAEAKRLKVHIRKAVLPMGIRSTKMLMYFIRKLVASESVKVSGKDIFISL